MQNMLSNASKQIQPSAIRKFFDVVNEMEGAISLGVGEPDFVTPWHIREAGIYSLEKGSTHYSANTGILELKEEICKYTKRKQNSSKGGHFHSYSLNRYAKFKKGILSYQCSCRPA